MQVARPHADDHCERGESDVEPEGRHDWMPNKLVGLSGVFPFHA